MAICAVGVLFVTHSAVDECKTDTHTGRNYKLVLQNHTGILNLKICAAGVLVPTKNVVV